ncbi:MAG: biopolymer transporter ExbD [Akkermansia sp.]
MQFYRKRTIASAVPIVPMIDILTILLIFFIIHSQWKKPQHLLKIDVPATEYMEGVKNQEKRGILSVSQDSQIALDGVVIKMDELKAILLQFHQQYPDKELQLDVDGKASFGTIVKIWDMLTAAGIDAKEVPARIEVQPAHKSR